MELKKINISYAGARRLAAMILMANIRYAAKGDLESRTFLLYAKEAEIYFEACGINAEMARERLQASWVKESAQVPCLTVTDMAMTLKITEVAVNRYIQMGRLPGFKVGRQWRVRKTDFDKFAERYTKYEKVSLNGPF